MMKKILSDKFAWSTIFAFIISLAFVLWPLTRKGFFVSDDGEWMIIRLSAFFQSLREGQFPVRFLGRLNHGYGYPVANFLYPGFLYIGSFIHALGFSFPATVKIIFALPLIISSFFVYSFLRNSFNIQASIFGLISFILSPYISYDIYTRGSVGEVLALAPASILLYALIKRKREYIPFALGFLLISHNSFAVLFITIYFAYLVVYKCWDFIVPSILGFGIGAFFWVPALYERSYVVFDRINVSEPLRYFAWDSRITLIGFFPLLACLYLLFLYKREDKNLHFFTVVLLICIFFVTPLSSIFWKVPLFGKLIQFPYRFLGIAVFAGSWIVSYIFSIVKRNRSLILKIIFIIITLIPVTTQILQVEYIDKEEGFYTTNEATTTVADEYMPKWVRDVPKGRSNARIEFVKGDGYINIVKSSTQNILAEVNSSQAQIVGINTIYYPGWGVLIDGIPVSINYTNPQGRMEVKIDPGAHILSASFRETPFRFAADAISIVSLFVSVFYVYIIRTNKTWHITLKSITD